MTWLARGGGVQNNVFLTIYHLQDEFEFHFAVGKEIQYNEFKNIENLKFFVCKDLLPTISPIRDLKSLFFFYKLIKQQKYDIVHTHNAKASLITRIAAWLAGCKFIIYGLHGVTFNDPLSKLRRLFYLLIEKSTIWMSDMIISVGADTLNHYEGRNIGRKIRSQVIYSGIDTDRFIKPGFTTDDILKLKKKLNIKSGDIVLINIGRFSFSKAQRYIIDSFARLTEKTNNIKLLLIGEGELQELCREQCRKLGVEDQVVFYGFSDNIPLMMKLGDIFVLTSLREGLPRVVVEASLSKLPVVAFEVEGIREIITNGRSGYIVPQYDVKQFLEKTTDLIQNVQLRNKFANEAFDHVVKKWDYRKMITDLRKIYNECGVRRMESGV